MKAAERPELSLDAESFDVDTESVDAMLDDAGASAALLLRASGLYRRKPTSGTLPIARRDELRLDVDGRYPQQVASGVLRNGKSDRLNWVAGLKSNGPASWAGPVFYRDTTFAMRSFTQVKIAVSRAGLGQPLRAEVAFSGGNTMPFTQVYDFVSRSFDPVEFEFDSTPDANPALAIQTHDHPNLPLGLPNETLSIAKVYGRAGFNVTVAPAAPAIPLAGAGIDGVWSDTEMHDAMQAHWSRFADQPQWAMWVFHAALHEQGTSPLNPKNRM